MKLIHCADIHLDSRMLTHLTTEQAKVRNIELLNKFCQMVAYGKEQRVDGILLAGDIFDSDGVSSYIINEVMEQMYAHPDISFFMVRGNHDRNVCLEQGRQLPDNLFVFDKNWKSYVMGSVCISGIECKEDSLLEKSKQLTLDAESINIVVLHGLTVEYTTRECNEDIIPLEQFRNKNIDYMALGHIHKYQYNRLDYRGAYCYSGCLEGRGFDECGVKGFVLLDIDESSKMIYNQFIPFAKRTLWEWEIDVSGCMTSAQMLRVIEKKLREESAKKEDYVKIKLVGELDVECEKNISYIRQKWEDSFFFVSVEDFTELKVDYGDFIMDASLKGEFVRMLQEENLTEQERTEIIRCGILALSGEEPGL